MILEIISVSLSVIAILASAITYFKHDKKLKEQERKINAYQLKQIAESEIESKKANIIGTTHKDHQNTIILTIKNNGKHVPTTFVLLGLMRVNIVFMVQTYCLMSF